jgi:hypothetical protein
MGSPMKDVLAYLENKFVKENYGGWGPHGWVSILGIWMEDNFHMGKVMVDEMEDK